MAIQLFEISTDCRIFDLDDIDSLRTIGIRKPSEVITRDRGRTRAWARRIYEFGEYAGVSWWCYYSPEWKSFGLWDLAGLRSVGKPEVLTVESDAVKVAATTIMRQLVAAEFSQAPRRPRRRKH